MSLFMWIKKIIINARLEAASNKIKKLTQEVKELKGLLVLSRSANIDLQNDLGRGKKEIERLNVFEKRCFDVPQDPAKMAADKIMSELGATKKMVEQIKRRTCPAIAKDYW